MVATTPRIFLIANDSSIEGVALNPAHITEWRRSVQYPTATEVRCSGVRYTLAIDFHEFHHWMVDAAAPAPVPTTVVAMKHRGSKAA